MWTEDNDISFSMQANIIGCTINAEEFKNYVLSVTLKGRYC